MSGRLAFHEYADIFPRLPLAVYEAINDVSVWTPKEAPHV